MTRTAGPCQPRQARTPRLRRAREAGSGSMFSGGVLCPLHSWLDSRAALLRVWRAGPAQDPELLTGVCSSAWPSLREVHLRQSTPSGTFWPKAGKPRAAAQLFSPEQRPLSCCNRKPRFGDEGSTWSGTQGSSLTATLPPRASPRVPARGGCPGPAGHGRSHRALPEHLQAGPRPHRHMRPPQTPVRPPCPHSRSSPPSLIPQGHLLIPQLLHPWSSLMQVLCLQSPLPSFP